MMKSWTPAEEAERLSARFAGVNRAEFARTHHVPGGGSMIYQHMQGIRPIGLEAAISYARGFRVPLSEISPRLAQLAKDALGGYPETAPRAVVPDKFAVLHQLAPACQDAILTLAAAMLSPSKTSTPASSPALAS